MLFEHLQALENDQKREKERTWTGITPAAPGDAERSPGLEKAKSVKKHREIAWAQPTVTQETLEEKW